MKEIGDLIEKANKILILAYRPDGDALGASVAMLKAISQIGKQVSAVVYGDVPKNYKFLDGQNLIKNTLSSDFVINIDISKASIDRIRTHPDLENKVLKIFLTPKAGTKLDQSMILGFGNSATDADLIFVLDTPEPQMIKAKDIDFEKVVNIDHHPSNKKFGKVNIIDVRATSTCEILYDLLNELQINIDSEIATALLTGIFDDTRTFQNANTTPRGMQIASELMALGADRKQIISNVYKNKPFNLLKFWGRILKNIKTDEQTRTLWSFASFEDFQEFGLDSTEHIIDELITGVEDYENYFVLSEKQKGFITGSLRTAKLNADKICAQLGGGGHTNSAGFKVHGKTLKDVGQMMLLAIKNANSLGTIKQQRENKSQERQGGAENMESETSKVTPASQSGESRQGIEEVKQKTAKTPPPAPPPPQNQTLPTPKKDRQEEQRSGSTANSPQKTSDDPFADIDKIQTIDHDDQEEKSVKTPSVSPVLQKAEMPPRVSEQELQDTKQKNIVADESRQAQKSIDELDDILQGISNPEDLSEVETAPPSAQKATTPPVPETKEGPTSVKTADKTDSSLDSIDLDDIFNEPDQSQNLPPTTAPVGTNPPSAQKQAGSATPPQQEEDKKEKSGKGQQENQKAGGEVSSAEPEDPFADIDDLLKGL
jgi:bifunctional oligoribonuclease and PAP phosphatase NrnA